MWQTDTVILQTKIDVNTYGSISQTWTDDVSVQCDVQDINKEYVFKNYGLSDDTEYKQIFDHTGANWIKGNQCSYNGEQWLIRLVNDSMTKIGASNHTYVIISKVV